MDQTAFLAQMCSANVSLINLLALSKAAKQIYI